MKAEPTRGTPRSRTRVLTGVALLLAMGVALPFAFHAIPLAGRILLPMHLPVFLAGLLLGPVAGLVVGVGSPLLSAAVTGRPPVLYMVPMLFELATYGLAAGLLRHGLSRVRGLTARPHAAVVASLVLAMLIGRAVWVTVVVWFAPILGIGARPLTAALAALGAGWPGMIIQLGLIPAILRAIERPSNS